MQHVLDKKDKDMQAEREEAQESLYQKEVDVMMLRKALDRKKYELELSMEDTKKIVSSLQVCLLSPCTLACEYLGCD